MLKPTHIKQSQSSSDRPCMLLFSCLFLWRCCTQATWSAWLSVGRSQIPPGIVYPQLSFVSSTAETLLSERPQCQGTS